MDSNSPDQVSELSQVPLHSHLSEEVSLQVGLWSRWLPHLDKWLSETDIKASVDFLSSLKPSGSYLELAFGSGRVVLALARLGYVMTAIEISLPLVESLNESSVGLPVTAMWGDMSSVDLACRYDVVYVIDGGLLGLTTQELQLKCFASVARVLEDGGVFVVESFVPLPQQLSPKYQVILRDLDHESVSLSAMRTDPASQRMSIQEIRLESGAPRLMPSELRYCYPSELDLMARLAGLFLVERYADFARTQFNGKSANCVSVYQRVE